MTRRKSSNRRSGSAAVEAALILPIVVFITLGAIDISQYINLSQLVVNTSREGARAASRDNTKTVEEVEDAMMAYLAGSLPQLTEAELADAVEIEVHSGDQPIPAGDLTRVDSGDPISVKVSFDFDDIRWISGPNYWNGNVNESTTICRRE